METNRVRPLSNRFAPTQGAPAATAAPWSRNQTSVTANRSSNTRASRTRATPAEVPPPAPRDPPTLTRALTPRVSAADLQLTFEWPHSKEVLEIVNCVRRYIYRYQFHPIMSQVRIVVVQAIWHRGGAAEHGNPDPRTHATIRLLKFDYAFVMTHHVYKNGTGTYDLNEPRPYDLTPMPATRNRLTDSASALCTPWQRNPNTGNSGLRHEIGRRSVAVALGQIPEQDDNAASGPAELVQGSRGAYVPPHRRSQSIMKDSEQPPAQGGYSPAKAFVRNPAPVASNQPGVGQQLGAQVQFRMTEVSSQAMGDLEQATGMLSIKEEAEESSDSSS